MDSELPETANLMWIQSLYKKNRKLNAVSFHSEKEKHPSRNIIQLHHENEIVIDPNYINQIMQDWYIQTSNTAQPQRETLPDFLVDLHLELPQISPDTNMPTEEITAAEVEEAINDAHKISAPGPSGQTITLCKLLFQEIPSIFTAAIN
jgi:hypothetical protein